MFRLCQLLFLCAVFAGNAFGPAQAKDKVIAVINGEEFIEKDFLTKKVKRKHRMAYAMNTFRMTAQRKLVELRLPDCQVKATDAQVSQYLNWLQGRLQTAGPANGVGDALQKIADRDERPVNFARQEIENWLPKKCIQDHYGANGFYVPMGTFDVMMAKQADNPTCVHSRDGFVVPCMRPMPDPIESISRLMNDAARDGQLSIPDPERSGYFFARYRKPDNANKTADEVLSDFETPYWLRAN